MGTIAVNRCEECGGIFTLYTPKIAICKKCQTLRYNKVVEKMRAEDDREMENVPIVRQKDDIIIDFDLRTNG